MFGPTYNSAGYYSFDGVSNYGKTDNTPSILQGDPNFTVFGFFRRTASFSGRGSWAIGSNATAQGICNWCGSATNGITIDMWGTSTFDSGQTYPLNTWVCVSWTKTAGLMTRANCAIFVNGVKYTGTQLSIQRAEGGSPNINNLGIFLGSIDSVSTNYNTPMDISNFFVYNRVLSDAEIIQNFNALRGRFGI
jgi:hypothetical protein